MSSLIVSLPVATAAQIDLELPYALVSDSAMLTQSGLAAIAAWPKATELVLHIPAQALAWAQVDLPKPGRALPAGKLRAVLEGLVEDQVLSDVAQLHLALPAQAPGGEKTWLAACDKAWLAAWIQLLEAQGRTVTRIVPEAAPQEAASLALRGRGAEDANWIYADSQGVLCAPWEHAAALLPADLSQVRISAEPGVAALAQKLLPEGAAVPIEQLGSYLARALGSDWNLGQFDLATTGRNRLWQRSLRLLRQWAFAPEWRVGRWGLAMLLVAQLLGLNVWAWQTRQDLAAGQKQLRAMVSRITGASYVSDQPVQQAQIKVQSLKQASATLGVGDAEPMLALLAAAMPSMPVGSRLKYEEQSLSLQAPALPAPALDKLRQTAAAAGYQVLTTGDSLEIRPMDAGAAPAALPMPGRAPHAPQPAGGQDASPSVPAAVISSLPLGQAHQVRG